MIPKMKANRRVFSEAVQKGAGKDSRSKPLSVLPSRIKKNTRKPSSDFRSHGRQGPKPPSLPEYYEWQWQNDRYGDFPLLQRDVKVANPSGK